MLMKLAQIYLEPALLIAYVIAAVAVAVLCECVIRGALKIVCANTPIRFDKTDFM